MRCKARAKGSGQRCKRVATAGQEVCVMHGGKSPQAKAAAARRLELQQAQAQVVLFGARRDIHPAEALLELVQWTAGEVDYWRSRVRDLEQSELTWGRTQHREGTGPEGPIDVTTTEAKPNVAYAMLRDASDRLARYAESALRGGIEERRVRVAEAAGNRLAESQRAILARMFQAIIDALRVQGVTDSQIIAALRAAWDEAMSIVVPEELRRLGNSTEGTQE